ncbi:MAG: ABC transporter permease subunit, partial [Actinomycetia bacterium]|nr:ABC transporter permease subunit [Actinomycetes bacterium]
LRPASLGLLAVLSVNISAMIAGTFVVEIVFGIGALGQVLIEASRNRDLYVLLGLTLYIVTLYVVVTSLIDLAMYWADPRIRRS